MKRLRIIDIEEPNRKLNFREKFALDQLRTALPVTIVVEDEE